MRILPALLACTLLLPVATLAQGRLGGGPLQPANPRTPERERPQGLPGLQARPNQVIPPTTSPAGMNPNDALFDAISRGDVATARDAVSRGADTNARNALGLTAIDSAVDQGRPEMIFYLLSLRGSAGSAPPPPGSEAPPPLRGRPGREPREARAPATPAAPAAPAAPRTARLFAGDGGAAQPEIGFLGFDAGRPAGATPAAGRAEPAREPRRRSARS
jgi:hypothetical protein